MVVHSVMHESVVCGTAQTRNVYNLKRVLCRPAGVQMARRVSSHIGEQLCQKRRQAWNDSGLMLDIGGQGWFLLARDFASGVIMFR